MLRLMLSWGIECSRAFWIARRRRRLESGLPPPALAAIMISLASLVNRLPRLASCAPLRSRMLCHLECPDMGRAPFKIVPGGCLRSGQEEAAPRQKESPLHCSDYITKLSDRQTHPFRLSD